MGAENIEDRFSNFDYLNALWSIEILSRVMVSNEDYDLAEGLNDSWRRISNDYIDFRLKHYNSEGRMVIRETYRILGYAPGSNQKMLGDGK